MGDTSAPPSFDSYQDALAACDPDTEMVCGTVADSGRPIYFVQPAGAGETAVRDVAFFLREGRPMSNYERSVLAEAERRHQ